MADDLDGLTIPVSTPGAPQAASSLEQVAQALDRTGSAATSSGEAVGRAESSWKDFASALDHTLNLASRFGEFADRIGAMSEEQERLNALSARLGVNFDQAAASAGRFADETEAMAAAGRFASADITVTQQRMNDLMRVAGAASLTLGTDTAGAVQQLQEALVRGREGGLQRFGTELASVAGQSHTVEERFAALHQQALRTAAAHDTAADSVKRFRDSIDDAGRTMAHAFTEEIARLSTITDRTHDAATATEEWNAKLRAGAQLVANFTLSAVNGVAVIGGAITTAIGGITGMVSVAAAGIAALPHGLAAARAAMTEELANVRRDGLAATAWRFTTEHADALDALSDDRERGGADAAPVAAPVTQSGAGDRRRHGGGGGGTHAAHAADMTFTAEERDTAERADRTSDLRGIAGLGAPANDNGVDGLLAQERTRQLGAQQEAARAAATFNSERARAVQERQLLAQREEAHRSFTGHMREMYGEQIALGRSLADSTKAAFDGMGTALGKHISALVAGKETLGQALKGMLSDTLDAISKEALAKGALYFAKGLGDLVTPGMQPLAAGDFAASAAYFGVGALAGAAGAAVAPSASASGGGAAAPARAAPVSSTSGGGSQAQPSTVTINYNAPSFGGRTGTMGEVGQHITRYTNVEAARTRRAA